MPELEKNIAEWRKRMAAGGIKKPAVLDELENHLREDIERRTRDGMAPEEAFTAAGQKIGPASALSKEFKRAAIGSVLEKLMLALAVLFLAFGVFLSVVTIIFSYDFLAERVMAFTALSFSLLTACFWSRMIPHLPVITHKRKRLSIEVATFLGGYGLAVFYAQLVLPHFEHSPDRVLPAVGFWAGFPVAIGLALACGLERAAKKPAARVLA